MTRVVWCVHACGVTPTCWQARLEACKVCLLNCGPTGSEAVKNLVLGGIASFTLVDKTLVEPRDLGNNFMVEASDVGKGRVGTLHSPCFAVNTAVDDSWYGPCNQPSTRD
jgi:amyloid beta precursor protein binding protein 1